ncbi:MAG: MFS transporter, partial [Ktedonobacteraceae bacterium]|nr:MFS transporter [Ktedonobacteraceae bacterium]
MASSTRPEPANQKKTSELARFRQVLNNRNFLLLWLAQLISMTILNAANFGVILLVSETTHSVVMVGVAIIAFTLPAIPFGALAGVVVDRQHKRTVLWVSNVLRIITMLLIFASLLYDRTNLWPLLTLVFLTSLIGQFFTPAEGAAIPLLVGKHELMPALSLFNITLTLSQAIGFLLLGRIVATIFPPFTLHLGAWTAHVYSTDMVFVIVAAFYAVCALLILAIPARALQESHVRQYHKERESVAMGRVLHDLWRDMLAGWYIVRADHLLFFSVLQLSLVGVLMQLVGELAPTFVQEILHRPAADMALILAPAAVGLVGSAVLVPHISERVGKMRLALLGFIALAVGFLFLPANKWLTLALDPRHGFESAWLFWSTIFVVFWLGVAMSCVNIPTQTVMQERSPEESRARVLSFQFMLY